MANQTKINWWGSGTAFPIDTEVTSTGEYPVESKGVKAYVDTAVANKIAEPVADATSETILDTLNGLLASLRAANLLKPTPVPPEPEDEETEEE